MQQYPGAQYGLPPPGMPPPQQQGYSGTPYTQQGNGIPAQYPPHNFDPSRYGVAPVYGAPAMSPYGGMYGAAAPMGGPPQRDEHYTTRPFHQGGQHVLGRDRCPFYHKMGACRHFDSCTKVHDKPTTSRTVILPMMYPNPKITPFYIMKHGREIVGEYDKKWLKKHVEDFYEDVFMMMMEYGRISDMRVVDNLCEHLLGNVYVKFEDEVAAQNAVDGLNGKMYNKVLLLPELSPVHDFPDATCKEAEEGTCKRAIQCNYWHPTEHPRPGSVFLKDLFEAQDKHWERVNKRAQEKQRERSPRRGATPPRRTHRSERSPESDARLCHICGRTGHISKDCPLKD